jgi:methionyl-tRNA formyltransferase
MKIVFYGGRNAGMNVLLYLIGLKKHTITVIPEDTIIRKTAEFLNLNTISLNNLNKESFDLFISCHGRKIIPDNILRKCLCLNIHPCLFKYKGADPIGRYMLNKDTMASVGCHIMTNKIDSGDVIYEVFFDTPVIKSYDEFYNIAYLFYVECIHKVMLKYEMMGDVNE